MIYFIAASSKEVEKRLLFHFNSQTTQVFSKPVETKSDCRKNVGEVRKEQQKLLKILVRKNLKKVGQVT